ncbi:2-oxoglutarate (2OG) and Fe(II)-dependent oxygenase superfamily protein [Striga asiatica]|uniref:2-oxoglutarate (2OG) and Fe(II)-dependent oxygenase superfamily protein n=1 Tax=Striga asiatica TaxID=4170 RepID=A0A5A7Q3E1_STRAF|nr:2-oxoglutarate (2OG) and Fe(II)-dependent oxygenase superfamily protein [Striga asiatica]
MATPTPIKSLSQAYNSTTHLQSQHIVPLDFNSIRDLPDSHVWTLQTDNLSESNKQYSVPVLDLTAPDVVGLVANACREWGVFQVINHGVPMGLFDDVEAQSKRLFGLPAQQKQKVLRLPNESTGYGVARISPFFSKLMWHEGFTIMGSAVEHAKQLWPLEYQDFCICSVLQLNSYPSCPNPNRAVGLGPHTDSMLLTILHQNDTNGLQILKEGVGWITVEPVSGAMVVNIGDLMHIMSNARFRPVYHRVVPSRMRHRFTFAYFYGPSPNYVVGPLASRVLDAPRFRPMMVKDYIRLKYHHFDKALDFVRL